MAVFHADIQDAPNFVHNGKRRIDYDKTHGLHADKQQSIIQDASTMSTNRNDMFNYQIVLLEYGMLLTNLCDVVSEGMGNI
jgi:hypothetical protein